MGKIIEASAPTIWRDAPPSGPVMPPLPSSPQFYARTCRNLPAATLLIYPGLAQAPNMLDCIPGGLVSK